MRILAISSQVAFEPVGNSAAVPALQWAGHEVLAVPTIILSHHPGYGSPVVLGVPAADLAAFLASLEDLGVLDGCAAVMTGYFAAAEQIHRVARLIRAMKAKTPGLYVMVDPIIGDGGELYVPLAVAEALRDDLLPLASVTTPNRFELEWLTGRPASTIGEAIAAARHLAVGEVVATSIPAGPGRLATLVVTGGGVHEHLTRQRNAIPHGTGDLLAGLYLALRLAHGPGEALPMAMRVLERAIALSEGKAGLDVAGALNAGDGA